MQLSVETRALERWLENCPDAEALGAGEYTVDLYDVETPLSLDVQCTDKGVELLAALTLCYDEEMDGWYLDQRVDDAQLITRMLLQAMAQAD